ncbi:isopentenyl-diphosphate delta-isomerase, partial [Candidatus Beckwithbacteria bacterium CG23_combo_of_CG06-09_8_20_14_all_34_8]
MNQNIILVNHKDEAIGETTIINSHLGEAKLHRAYTVILRNNKGEILLTKRSLKKPLWPTYWDGSFSSHPRVGETLEQSCERRAKEELGIEVKDFKDLFNYSYHIKWNTVFS